MHSQEDSRFLRGSVCLSVCLSSRKMRSFFVLPSLTDDGCYISFQMVSRFWYHQCFGDSMQFFFSLSFRITSLLLLISLSFHSLVPPELSCFFSTSFSLSFSFSSCLSSARNPLLLQGSRLHTLTHSILIGLFVLPLVLIILTPVSLFPPCVHASLEKRWEPTVSCIRKWCSGREKSSVKSN